MADTLGTTTGTTDAELIASVRAGDTGAYGVLFDRHREAALLLARQLVRGPDADDLVAESFVRVLTTLQNGKGPDESFRAYLLTSLRHLHVDRFRAAQRVRPTGDEAELDRAVAFVDPAEMRFEQGAAAAAFASLPERWQLVLWHLDVEGQKPAAIAPLLGMSANSVSALAYRAREGLRQAYLQGHLAPTLHESCRRTTGLLGSYVRKGLSARDTAAVDAHLDDCSRCTGLSLELADVNHDLAGVLGPALLGAAFAGYAASAATASAAAGAGALLGLKAVAGQAAKVVLEPVKALGSTVAGAGTQGVVAAAVVTATATVGTVAVATDVGGRPDERPRASAPAVPGPTPTDDGVDGPTPAASPEAPPADETVAEPPAVVPPVDPAPSPVVPPEPEPAEPAAVAPERPAPAEADDEPAPPVAPPVVPTDYGVGQVAVVNDASLLQRRITVPVNATTSGRAADQQVTVTVAFARPVRLRSLPGDGWDCGTAAVGRRARAVACTATLRAGEGGSLVLAVRALVRPAGTVTVSSDGDPVPGNDTAAFRAPPYLLVL